MCIGYIAASFLEFYNASNNPAKWSYILTYSSAKWIKTQTAMFPKF